MRDMGEIAASVTAQAERLIERGGVAREVGMAMAELGAAMAADARWRRPIDDEELD